MPRAIAPHGLASDCSLTLEFREFFAGRAIYYIDQAHSVMSASSKTIKIASHDLQALSNTHPQFSPLPHRPVHASSGFFAMLNPQGVIQSLYGFAVGQLS